MYPHILVIGGTGMLRNASVSLSLETRCLTSIARTRQSLASLDKALPPEHGTHHMLALDWSNPDGFLQKIVQHVKLVGYPGLVLAWIHDSAVAIRLAEALDQGDVEFFHVIGSSGTNPARIAEQAYKRLKPARPLAYHQVILGTKQQGRHSRWLTHDEISRGVLGAIARKRPTFVVGTLTHW